MSRDPVLWSLECRQRTTLDDWNRQSSVLRAHRDDVARVQAERLAHAEVAIYNGFCWCCGGHAQMVFDRKYAAPGTVNWRERLVCTGCNLNSRLRLALQVFEDRLGPEKGARVYLTEHLTPFARMLERRGWAPVTSEYLAGTPLGTEDTRGIRSEDLTRLTFPDASFDAVLSFDVFEHIPDYRSALREVFRVLRPGGRALLSFPFASGRDDNLVRATLGEDGNAIHHLPAEYHGDPVDPTKGVLCYYHFGWQILDDILESGFSDARADWYWSSDYGYIGREQPMFIAVKSVAS